VPRRALVVSVVHHPDDARIRYRQIQALLDAGWDVTYAAPFSGYDLPIPGTRDVVGLVGLDLPRAAGRRRTAALRAARQLLRTQGRMHDVVLLHDPELLLALPGTRGLPAVIWDVHEDTAASVTLKPWLPAALRRGVATLTRRVETIAERHVHLLLAEGSYTERFRGNHRVVPNTVRVPATVPEPGTERVVYLGHLSLKRGAADIAAVATQVHAASGGAVEVEVIGHADGPATEALTAAEQAGQLTRTGFLPSHQALARLDGALAGLSLLHDEPNYHFSLPTKLVEYMAHGVPVITTPLPLAQQLVTETEVGVVVPFERPDLVVEEILRLRADADRRIALGRAGHRIAQDRYDWTTQAKVFVAEVERIAATG